MVLLRAFLFSCVLLAVSAVPSAATITPVISFETAAVVASGITPGGKVVWFSVAREIAEHSATIVPRQQVVEDTTSSGTVRLELERDVPFQSIWVAVDLTTGASAVAVPEGYPLRTFEVAPTAARHTEGVVDSIGDTRGYVEVLLVRPATGAWWATVGDGGATDGDALYDGQVVASLPDLEEVDGSTEAAPEDFAVDDVIVILDPINMEVGIHELKEVE